MTRQEMTPTQDEITRVAHAIWEHEGRPEGRDHEHWMRAKQLILEGRAEAGTPAPRRGVEHDGEQRPSAARQPKGSRTSSRVWCPR